MGASPTPDADSAAEAGLVYVSDEAPGITRRRRGRGFPYTSPSGRPASEADRARITALAIPPAWTDVWIANRADGHLLATGRDDRDRKQYLYHPDWRAIRDAAKFDRMSEFGLALPDLRSRVDSDLARHGLPQDKVVATIVRLLDDTLVRVGNEAYAEDNESYGLTTLTSNHASVRGDKIRFEFTAKGGAEADVLLSDRRLATIVSACQELPGQDLFQYVDEDGQGVNVTSTHVNDYLRAAVGDPVTAKDFRTWGGTVVATEHLATLPASDADADDDAHVLAAIDAAAERLGNTRTVCRDCYVHPQVADAWRDGRLGDAWTRSRSSSRFSRAERTVARILGG